VKTDTKEAADFFHRIGYRTGPVTVVAPRRIQ
jgi:hypothetical protein